MASHSRILLPAAFLIGAACLAGCSDPGEPLPDGAAPPPASESVPSANDDLQPPPLSGSAAIPANLCEPLNPADAAEFSEEAESVGMLGASELLGSRNDLACSEPYLEDHVECELRAGGTAFLRKDGDVSGLRNISGAPAILAATSDTIGCNPLSPPDIDPNRRPL